jgi:prepilin-type N-terminal cleavage/methylation domain-containing protein
MANQHNNRILKGEDGYTLIELLITIFIVGIIMLAISSLLIQMIRISQIADVRRSIRQDLEVSLEVMRRDLRNADPALSVTSCNPNDSLSLVSATTPDTLDIVLSNGLEDITYAVESPTGSTVKYLTRTYDNDGTPVKVYLTSEETDITKFDIDCNSLLKGNKFLLIEVAADSTALNQNGNIAKDIVKYTGVTIRNTSE